MDHLTECDKEQIRQICDEALKRKINYILSQEKGIQQGSFDTIKALIKQNTAFLRSIGYASKHDQRAWQVMSISVLKQIYKTDFS